MRALFIALLLLAVVVSGFGEVWVGNWFRKSLQNGAEIVITAEKPGSFHFAVTAYSGAHTGEMEGDAVVSGNKAAAVLESGEEKREAIFERTKEGVTLDTVNCEGFFGGADVVFDGAYVRDQIASETLAEKQLQTIVGNRDLVTYARNELGQYFVDVVYCLHLVSDAKNLDPFEAKAYSGCVLGLGPEMAAIIMYTKNLKIYVAWYSDGKLNYLSSDPAFKNKLPKTILEWAKQYAGAKVDFK
jgi:hypothetical protein